MTFRVPLLTISFRFGFSSRMIFLMWCVCGGFLLHMLECNYLTMLLKTNYEKPVDSAEDIIDRGLKVISGPGVESMVEMLKNSPLPLIRAFAERTVVPKVTFSNPVPYPIHIFSFPPTLDFRKRTQKGPLFNYGQ